ncbi:hypothetical protein Tsubulata_049863 [Turnera subulata]|uniref:B box-type domain-containing protein n=1 Tax=Turnera subulata TaxID=218843 RepID=A0A9Q0G5F4_9ROSI|nr:hypothetical protein Tsubulata_049863 [Turnera subulata]
MITERRAANAMGGKTARACDSCLRKRARWFCAADDAFLCQACDASVHSANQLASRHERVRLHTASAKSSTATVPIKKEEDSSVPAWHQGFTRKARTPRNNNSNSKSLLVQQLKDEEEKLPNPLLLVPEMGSEEEGNMLTDEGEDRFHYRVPEFDPFAAELGDMISLSEEGDMAVDACGQEATCELDDLPSLLPSDVDLAEFAADVENLLGGGLDEDPADVKDLGFLESKEQEENGSFCFGDDKVVKVKDEQEVETIPGFHFDHHQAAIDMTRDHSLVDWNFDDEYPAGVDEEIEEKVLPMTDETQMVNSECKKDLKRSVSLRLDYEAVITAWASQGCPWTTGSRPQINTDDCWPDCMGACPKGVHHPYGSLLGRTGGGDGGREARVMRYKEKRRTRLFSKKIRYEVRKRNAEKRPRMKGRFVKRTSFMAGATAFPNYLHQ